MNTTTASLLLELAQTEVDKRLALPMSDGQRAYHPAAIRQSTRIRQIAKALISTTVIPEDHRCAIEALPIEARFLNS